MSIETAPAPATPNAAQVSTPDTPPSTVPEQSRGERRTSFDPADFPVPHGREEEWRYTPLDRLQGLLNAPDFDAAGLTLTSRTDQNVHVSTVTRDEARALASAGRPGDRGAVLADASAAQVTVVRITADAHLTEPIVIDQVGLGQDAPVAAHLVVLAERHSQAAVVLRFSGAATLADRVEIVAEDGAHLTVVTVHEWQDDAIHLSEHDVYVGRDADVRHITATLGGHLVRQSTNTRYAAPGGSFEGLGVYFADAGQHLEHRLFVDHDTPNCRSNVVYKGALQGASAHTVWVGDVLIRATAHGTDTYELNRNLVLTDGARADSVPNLEIETGDIVGAGHASATGRFDDEQLFYLMARGIPQDEARRLVVRAFFADIVNKIGIQEISEHLMAVVDDELAASMGPVPAPQESDQ
ncbi:hypothetical protein KEM60_01623 [Austwickia sp. TVS 96-490-7B]|uniref:Fe-S cluster assembly protein SufD n=1 Tax=Austwickia sp. TVS 96-490-7B TaxID=2830843 RepID=UPI001C56B553|nr:Fe-S cluster assembly protein SufD [Austwickia sp. TVS 96-490-7B]MBW3085423.1 hypothetical protein [Austwickia sp. TVS 96-490-7B]